MLYLRLIIIAKKAIVNVLVPGQDLQNSSVFSWPQNESVANKSQQYVGNEFHAMKAELRYLIDWLWPVAQLTLGAQGFSYLSFFGINVNVYSRIVYTPLPLWLAAPHGLSLRLAFGYDSTDFLDGWLSADRLTISVYSQPRPSSTQPSIPPGWINRLPVCQARVKAERVYLCQVISNMLKNSFGRWRSVAMRWVFMKRHRLLQLILGSEQLNDKQCFTILLALISV